MKTVPARAGWPLALAALITAASAHGAKPPPPPTGELLLDMRDPVIAVTIGEVPLRLRVGLEAKRLIQLNPDAAARLEASPPDRKFRFESGADAQIGRETLKGVEAAAPITINARKMIVTVASHGRDCCAGVDGEIGIGLLPYATIRFVRAALADAGRSIDFAIEDNDEAGPEAVLPVGRNSIHVQFSFARPDSVATSSAGALLAQAHGGRLTESEPTVAAFGIARPTATLRFPQPITIAGFRFGQLRVRTADFAGSIAFPADPADEGDIVVRKKVEQQRAWPVVLLGRDRLDRCSEALFDTIAKRLTLRCAFDGVS
ncbi:hypothetical protein [Sphingomonas sp. SRS2]|uniref:hypothetical protein n=1 Tax=Sphingomonas sp. SRS2 TaxID=133190 RepID=UPI00061849FB|nr:hypothetical protein [Sphingomonas sp. SRS2]KKC27937.1 hypothetical protein WP12_00435 [Sphingomonas sp. SRS2]